jgi:hypothetical protein
VVDGARFAGALTPESVFESLRASMRIEGDELGEPASGDTSRGR